MKKLILAFQIILVVACLVLGAKTWGSSSLADPLARAVCKIKSLVFTQEGSRGARDPSF